MGRAAVRRRRRAHCPGALPSLRRLTQTPADVASFPRPTRQHEAKLEEVRKAVKAELEVRGVQEGPLGFDGGAFMGASALMGSAGGDHDDDRGPGGRPKRRR